MKSVGRNKKIFATWGVIALFGFLNRWNDSMGTEMEAGAIESGEKYLKQNVRMQR